MDVHKIPPGANPPDEIHVLIEIPEGGVSGQVRARQGFGCDVRKSFPSHCHVLSG
jgi:inorganic pyrophosphatase